MNLKLKFKIIEKYGTQTIFAKACKRNDSWISRIITERQKPTEEELKLIVSKLDVPSNEIF